MNNEFYAAKIFYKKRLNQRIKDSIKKEIKIL